MSDLSSHGHCAFTGNALATWPMAYFPQHWRHQTTNPVGHLFFTDYTKVDLDFLTN
jgi:hypothetical protein